MGHFYVQIKNTLSKDDQVSLGALQLELGKSYLNRDGETVTIVRTDGGKYYPFRDQDELTYSPTGLFDLRDAADNRNLVSEVSVSRKGY